MKTIKEFIKKTFGPWQVRRTIWPYKEGWGTYNPSTRTIVDTGLSREEAQRRCDALNLSEGKEKIYDSMLVSE